MVLGIGHHINRDELLQITGSEEYAFQNLHKEEELKNFVKSFANISQEIQCDLIRSEFRDEGSQLVLSEPRGASVVCNDDGFTVTVSTSEPLKVFFTRKVPKCKTNNFMAPSTLLII